MLNNGVKREALDRLEKADKAYQTKAESVHKAAGGLFELRKATAEQAIQSCEDYVNSLSNSPKEFDKSVAEFKVEYQKFTALIAELHKLADNTLKVSGSAAGGGVLVGAGVAALGPTAAMAVATTFGTASTGTAISALSGAAATKAALAWLGGGALATGGGGMIAGKALLALAGPVGWTIGGLGMIGGGLMMRKKNAEIAEQATKEAVRIEANISQLNAAELEVENLVALTVRHTEGLKEHLSRLLREAPRDYANFTHGNKLTLAALINNVQSLSKLLNKKVE